MGSGFFEYNYVLTAVLPVIYIIGVAALNLSLLRINIQNKVIKSAVKIIGTLIILYFFVGSLASYGSPLGRDPADIERIQIINFVYDVWYLTAFGYGVFTIIRYFRTPRFKGKQGTAPSAAEK